MVKKYILALLLVLALFGCNKNYALTLEEKIQIFLKYDELFHYSDEKGPGFEKGYKYEILDIKNISPEYQNITLEYQKILTDFINNNRNYFISLFTKKNEKYFLNKHLEKKYDGYEYAYDAYQNIKGNMNKLFKTHDTFIRSLCAVEANFLFQFGRTFKNSTSTILNFYIGKEDREPYWGYYYFALLWDWPLVRNEGDKNYNRDLKQDYWFYESNMKIVVVQRMQDENGNYLCEISMDFYKLQDFDMLFNPDGTLKEVPK